MYNLNRSFNPANAAALISAVVSIFFDISVQSTAAEDLAVELPAPASTQPAADEPAAPFDNVNFGIALTNDYMSRGATNSNSKPAAQGYVELDFFKNAYLSVWSSNVDFGEGFTGAEIDVLGGIRPEFPYGSGDKLTLDLGYVHYFYAPEHVSPDYGELFGRAKYEFKDGLILGGDAFFAPDYSQSGSTATWVEAKVIRAPLWKIFSAVGGLGYQFRGDFSAFEQLAWNAGVSAKLNDSWTLDVRYYDSNIGDDDCVFLSGFANGCDARVVATLSLDTGWKAARDWASGK